MAASAMLVDPKPISAFDPPQSLPLSKTDVVIVSSPDDEDLYGRLKSLQRQLGFTDTQEEYVKDELKILQRELLRAQEEVKRIQSVPLVIGQFMEMVDQNNGIVGSTTGSNYYVRILSTINLELLKPSASVALHRHSNALVDVLPAFHYSANPRSLMSPTMILVDVTYKSTRFVKLLNYPSRTMNCTSRLVLILLVVCCSMVPLVQVKPCFQRLLQTTLLQFS